MFPIESAIEPLLLSLKRGSCELPWCNSNLWSVVVLPRSENSGCLESRRIARFVGDISSEAQKEELMG